MKIYTLPLWTFLVLIFLPGTPLSANTNSIQCANLVYGGTHTSRCFSDEFLTQMQEITGINTERRFKSVKLDSEEVFAHPFVMMTGEQDFHFSSRERENLKHYLLNGGFMLASAGCSSSSWDTAFRRNIRAVFGDEYSLEPISMDHPIFRTVHEIDQLELSRGDETAQLEGIEVNGKLVLVYSSEGLNDSANTTGCCCCGGNEISNAAEVNLNILIYALLH
ncbi:MAG: DUF4159 domain-containing protein [Opitutales bacterium]|nr:DUF4159 domain-containing protein [Opitutales bacterium]MCH8540616.1 DUF4159 domain-containing protein [Opitutales bacterium]